MKQTTATQTWALASLSLAMLMPSLDTSIANSGLPTLAQAFGASFQAVQWIVLAYLLAITTSIVTVGRFGDLLGRRRLLLAGILLFTLASLLCGLAPTLALLIIARALQGLGAAIMMALTLACAGELVPPERTGRVMGLLGTMSAIGTTLGPACGGLLIAGPGWRMIFLVNLPLGLLNLVLAYRYLPADPPRDPSRRIGFDPLGTLVLALTLAAYALAMTLDQGTLLKLALLLTAGAGCYLFVRVESRATAPLLQLAMFRNPDLSCGLARSVVVSTVIMSTLVVGPFYLAQGLDLPATQVGLTLSVGPFVAALAGIPAGRIVDRFGSRPMTLLGLIGIASGCFALALLPSRFGLPGYLLPIVWVTAHYALFQTANNTALMTGIPAARKGVVSGMLNLSRNLGLISGASLMGAIFAQAAAVTDLSVAPPEMIARGMHVSFAVAGLFILAALALPGERKGSAPSLPNPERLAS